MLRAGPARTLELAAERLPRPVKADTGIPGGETQLVRDCAHPGVLEVHSAEDTCVLGAQHPHELRHAAADHPLERGIGARLRSDAPRAGRGLLVTSAPAVVIGDGVPKQPVEPGDRPLPVADRASAFEALSERRLEDVFGVLARTNPPL